MSRALAPARRVPTGFEGATASVSPKLHDAILDLHREDPLRRAYVRRRWIHRAQPTMDGQ
jgi:hypothetical protein